jgi:hypothetical protein
VVIDIASGSLQGVFKGFQALRGVGGPHEEVVAQSVGVALGILASFNDVQLEPVSAQEQGCLRRAKGHRTFEQVPVEAHGPFKFGYVQNG